MLPYLTTDRQLIFFSDLDYIEDYSRDPRVFRPCGMEALPIAAFFAPEVELDVGGRGDAHRPPLDRLFTPTTLSTNTGSFTTESALLHSATKGGEGGGSGGRLYPSLSSSSMPQSSSVTSSALSLYVPPSAHPSTSTSGSSNNQRNGTGNPYGPSKQFAPSEKEARKMAGAFLEEHGDLHGLESIYERWNVAAPSEDVIEEANELDATRIDPATLKNYLALPVHTMERFVRNRTPFNPAATPTRRSSPFPYTFYPSPVNYELLQDGRPKMIYFVWQYDDDDFDFLNPFGSNPIIPFPEGDPSSAHCPDLPYYEGEPLFETPFNGYKLRHPVSRYGAMAQVSSFTHSAARTYFRLLSEERFDVLSQMDPFQPCFPHRPHLWISPPHVALYRTGEPLQDRFKDVFTVKAAQHRGLYNPGGFYLKRGMLSEHTAQWQDHMKLLAVDTLDWFDAFPSIQDRDDFMRHCARVRANDPGAPERIITSTKELNKKHGHYVPLPFRYIRVSPENDLHDPIDPYALVELPHEGTYERPQWKAFTFTKPEPFPAEEEESTKKTRRSFILKMFQRKKKERTHLFSRSACLGGAAPRRRLLWKSDDKQMEYEKRIHDGWMAATYHEWPNETIQLTEKLTVDQITKGIELRARRDKAARTVPCSSSRLVPSAPPLDTPRRLYPTAPPLMHEEVEVHHPKFYDYQEPEDGSTSSFSDGNDCDNDEDEEEEELVEGMATLGVAEQPKDVSVEDCLHVGRPIELKRRIDYRSRLVVYEPVIEWRDDTWDHLTAEEWNRQVKIREEEEEALAREMRTREEEEAEELERQKREQREKDEAEELAWTLEMSRKEEELRQLIEMKKRKKDRENRPSSSNDLTTAEEALERQRLEGIREEIVARRIAVARRRIEKEKKPSMDPEEEEMLLLAGSRRKKVRFDEELSQDERYELINDYVDKKNKAFEEACRKFREENPYGVASHLHQITPTPWDIPTIAPAASDVSSLPLAATATFSTASMESVKREIKEEDPDEPEEPLRTPTPPDPMSSSRLSVPIDEGIYSDYDRSTTPETDPSPVRSFRVCPFPGANNPPPPYIDEDDVDRANRGERAPDYREESDEIFTHGPRLREETPPMDLVVPAEDTTISPTTATVSQLAVLGIAPAVPTSPDRRSPSPDLTAPPPLLRSASRRSVADPLRIQRKRPYAHFDEPPPDLIMTTNEEKDEEMGYPDFIGTDVASLVHFGAWGDKTAANSTTSRRPFSNDVRDGRKKKIAKRRTRFFDEGGEVCRRLEEQRDAQFDERVDLRLHLRSMRDNCLIPHLAPFQLRNVQDYENMRYVLHRVCTQEQFARIDRDLSRLREREQYVVDHASLFGENWPTRFRLILSGVSRAIFDRSYRPDTDPQAPRMVPFLQQLFHLEETSRVGQSIRADQLARRAIAMGVRVGKYRTRRGQFHAMLGALLAHFGDAIVEENVWRDEDGRPVIRPFLHDFDELEEMGVPALELPEANEPMDDDDLYASDSESEEEEDEEEEEEVIIEDPMEEDARPVDPLEVYMLFH